MMEQRESTYKAVQASLADGTSRAYGKNFMHTNLLLEGHHARKDDVEDALKALDPIGSSARNLLLDHYEEASILHQGLTSFSLLMA
jgi:hypothetical protein